MRTPPTKKPLSGLKRPSLYALLLLICCLFFLIQVLLSQRLHQVQQAQNASVGTDPQHHPPPLDLPVSDYPYTKTNKTMAACLFLMDDTIRLTEWLAYHYTVLPLGHLVVAIDPHSKEEQKILDILDSYRPYLPIDAYTNDSWLTLGDDEGWGRQLRGPLGNYRHWFKDKTSEIYRAQAHKRRQNFFSSFCLQSLFKKGVRSWTVLIDSDEFLVFNYRHASQENASIYDAETEVITKEHIDIVRDRVIPVRERLPSLTQGITIADFVHDYLGDIPTEGDDSALNALGRGERKAQAMNDHALETFGVKLDRRPRCLRFPHLRFSSYESSPALVNRSLSEEINGNYLITMRQRKHGAVEGLFSKAMLDLSQAKSADWFNFKGVVNIHTPSRRMCGRQKKKTKHSGSGTDYLSSVFRINHYRSGTIETYLERSGDYRGGSIWRFYAERNVAAVAENDDIRPWIHWFIEKVGGMETAKRLLTGPLEEFYHHFQNHESYANAKEVLERLQGDDPLEHGAERKSIEYNYTRTDKSMSACMYIQNDEIRLIEWLAYHHTVLPLRDIVVGVDPRSTQVDELRASVERWSDRMNVTVWTNNEWMSNVGESEGFKNRPLDDNNNPHSWFANKTGDEYLQQLDIRSELYFISECAKKLRNHRPQWTVIVDSDEFLVFNYKGKQENPFNYDAKEQGVRTKDDIIEARTLASPIRDRLPPLQNRVTLADLIVDVGLEKCFRMPGLEMGPKEFVVSGHAGLPEGINQLLTLRQREFGRKVGTSTRAVMDLSQAHSVARHQAFTKSSPNLGLCGVNGRLEATDYMAALVRYQKYDIGSIEAFVEHEHINAEISLQHYRNVSEDFVPYGDEHDTMLPWISWFIDSVGKDEASRLLFEPLKAAYQRMDANEIVQEAKAEQVSEEVEDE